MSGPAGCPNPRESLAIELEASTASPSASPNGPLSAWAGLSAGRRFLVAEFVRHLVRRQEREAKQEGPAGTERPDRTGDEATAVAR